MSELREAGNKHVADKNFEAARDAYLQAIEADATDYKAHSNVSMVYLKLNDIPSAIEHATKAIELSPTFGKAYGRLCRAHQANHDSSLALAAVDAGLAQCPDEAMLMRLRLELSTITIYRDGKVTTRIDELGHKPREGDADAIPGPLLNDPGLAELQRMVRTWTWTAGRRGCGLIMHVIESPAGVEGVAMLTPKEVARFGNEPGPRDRIAVVAEGTWFSEKGKAGAAPRVLAEYLEKRYDMSE